MREQHETEQAKSENPASAQPKRTTGLARTSALYWKEQVERVAGRGGKESPTYSARIVHQKRRVRFPLSTPNKDAAAKKAAQIFQFLIDHGWDATIEKFKPHTIVTESTEGRDTVGALILAASSLSSARPQSKEAYAKAFRRIVADISGIGDGRKFDGTKGFTEWREKVDAVKLATISPTKVLEWKNAFLEKSGSDPRERQSAKVTVNSLFRNAKALFSRKTLPFLMEKVALPSPLPFDGLPMEKQPSMRYQSRIDAAKILETAQDELSSQPEIFKALLLSLICGLRVSEIDHLLWSAFDFEKGVLRAESTEYHELKSHDSGGDIDLQPETLALFRGFRAKASSQFVLESPNTARKRKRTSRCYRCDSIFNALRVWLKAQGVPGKKPIHEMRKEIGSLIASEHGIYAASRFLRHSDIRITTAVYVDKKTRIAPSIGSLVKSRENIEEMPLVSRIPTATAPRPLSQKAQS